MNSKNSGKRTAMVLNIYSTLIFIVVSIYSMTDSVIIKLACYFPFYLILLLHWN